MARVSVLMPVYNGEAYLEEAIKSIIGQSYTDWELIVINDGSTDNTKQIIRSFEDNRIKYYENTENCGLIETLNNGLTLCQNEYIARMDADDIAHPKRLELQVDKMDKDSKLAMCGTAATVINSQKEEIGKVVNPTNNTDLQISLLFTNPFIHPSVMIRRCILKNLRFSKEALHIEDFLLWTELAERGNIANLATPLLSYRWHETNVSVKHNDTQEKTKDKIIKDQLIRVLNLNPTEDELKTHRLTFTLYHLGLKQKITTDDNKKVAKWFEKLALQNRVLNRFPTADFNAFLWSRWIVLCIFTNKVSSIFIPTFIPIRPKTILKTIRQVIWLSKK